MTSDDLEPIAWEVTAAVDRTFVNGKRPAPIRQRFRTEAAAIARGNELRDAGRAAVAVTPVYPSKKQREERNRERQYMPLGQFCADWTMKE